MTECSMPTFTLNCSTSGAFYLPKPTWDNAKASISKDVVLFNFWSNELDTVDKGINEEPEVLIGIWQVCGEWEGFCLPICLPICFSNKLSDAVDELNDIMNNGEEITINELGDCLNGVFIIQDFQFSTIKGTPMAFTYMLKLQKVRDI